MTVHASILAKWIEKESTAIPPPSPPPYQVEREGGGQLPSVINGNERQKKEKIPKPCLCIMKA